MFTDEAGFGRISEPAYCWAPPKQRPFVPCQKVREYRTVYGAVSPKDGKSFFVVMEGNNSENMTEFLQKLSAEFPDDVIMLCCDNAGWHTSKKVTVPENICLFYIPPRTPEMNPIEQIWKEIRKRGFKNKLFNTIDEVVSKFNEVVKNLLPEAIISITLREWIYQLF